MSKEINFLDMSDDEIMGMTAPVAAPAAVEVVEPVVDAPPTPDDIDKGEGREADAVQVSTPPAPAGEVDAAPAVDAPSAFDRADEDDADTATPPAPANTKPEGDAADVVAEPPAVKPEEAAKGPSAEDHKALYEMLLNQPIKANGREIKLQSPEEVVKLVQMGLNYTKKMQAMQPALRVVKMLENNGLMDESKLSHLIDISKGDSGAIQKLLADSKFDPMSADTEQAAKYVPADHRVSPLEMSFAAVLEEVEQTPTGVELISEVHGQWDADSKRALFEKPEILSVLAEQKAAGLYAQINSEVDRLRALGQITPDIPFLQAYYAVGDMLNTQGRLVPKAPVAVEAPVLPVETRVAAPVPRVQNTAQAQATAPVRTAPSNPAPASIDYLSMDDAEFAKQTVGRF